MGSGSQSLTSSSTASPSIFSASPNSIPMEHYTPSHTKPATELAPTIAEVKAVDSDDEALPDIDMGEDSDSE